MNSSNQGAGRSHIYEIDLLRVLTALTVIAVHTLAFSSGVYKTLEGATAHYAVLDTIHWTRNVFLFITAFVLTLVYYDKPFSFRRFWNKRAIGVLLPYALWSMAYTWFNRPTFDPIIFAREAIPDILTGNASYQLYYILLTLQVYLILPLFFIVLRVAARRPWLSLVVSFALELVIMYVAYYYIQQGPIASSPYGSNLDVFENRFVGTYQFYLILGGLAALHMESARAWLLRHGKAVVGIFGLTLVITLVSYLHEVAATHNLDLSSRVLQPAEMVYSLAVIIFLCWLGALWARESTGGKRPPMYAFWHKLSDASFGIYLVHAFLLTHLLLYDLPQMPEAWPPGLRVFLVWVLAAAGSALVSAILVSIPIVSRTVGRSAEWHLPGRMARQQPEPQYSASVPRDGKVEPGPIEH